MIIAHKNKKSITYGERAVSQASPDEDEVPG